MTAHKFPQTRREKNNPQAGEKKQAQLHLPNNAPNEEKQNKTLQSPGLVSIGSAASAGRERKAGSINRRVREVSAKRAVKAREMTACSSWSKQVALEQKLKITDLHFQPKSFLKKY